MHFGGLGTSLRNASNSLSSEEKRIARSAGLRPLIIAALICMILPATAWLLFHAATPEVLAARGDLARAMKIGSGRDRIVAAAKLGKLEEANGQYDYTLRYLLARLCEAEGDMDTAMSALEPLAQQPVFAKMISEMRGHPSR